MPSDFDLLCDELAASQRRRRQAVPRAKVLAVTPPRPAPLQSRQPMAKAATAQPIAARADTGKIKAAAAEAGAIKEKGEDIRKINAAAKEARASTPIPPAVDDADLPLDTAPPHEIRRRILGAEGPILAKAFGDLRTGKIDALELLNIQLKLHDLRSVEAVATGASRA